MLWYGSSLSVHGKRLAYARAVFDHHSTGLGYHRRLAKHIHTYLTETLGLSDDVICRFLLGWNGFRIATPERACCRASCVRSGPRHQARPSASTSAQPASSCCRSPPFAPSTPTRSCRSSAPWPNSNRRSRPRTSPLRAGPGAMGRERHARGRDRRRRALLRRRANARAGERSGSRLPARLGQLPFAGVWHLSATFFHRL